MARRRHWLEPSPFVVTALSSLRESGAAPPGWALDVACGVGRHSRVMARAGYDVLAVDRDALALRVVRGIDGVRVIRADLENGSWEPPPERFTLVVNTLFWWRPLLPALMRSLRPGGAFVAESFTTQELERRGGGTREFYLREGELRELFADWHVVSSHEDPRDGKYLAGIVAIRP